ncbi:hypothetical protein [Peptoniphilus harei]|uniref:hypothetical protein n=1 Tax=Peptoniphilus harei TaxID=54005 RepID=UPI0039843FC6
MGKSQDPKKTIKRSKEEQDKDKYYSKNKKWKKIFKIIIIFHSIPTYLIFLKLTI